MLADRIAVISAHRDRSIEEVTTGRPRTRNSRILSDAWFGAITARPSSMRAETVKSMSNAWQLRSGQRPV
jgi:hypothetical protein